MNNIENRIFHVIDMQDFSVLPYIKSTKRRRKKNLSSKDFFQFMFKELSLQDRLQSEIVSVAEIFNTNA